MSIKDMRMINENVLRLIKNNALVWDRNAENFRKDLTLWIPGLSGILDESESNHVTTTTFDLGNVDHLEFRNSQYIDLPDDVGYVDKLTVMSWYRHKGSPLGNHHILLGGGQLELTIHQTGYLRTGIYIDGVRHVANFTHPDLSLNDGQWHHVGFSFDGSKMKRYIDGLFVGETTLPSGTLDAVFSSRRVGRYGASSVYYANGDIYDLRIYNKAKDGSFFDALYKDTDKTSIGKYMNYIGCQLG